MAVEEDYAYNPIWRWDPPVWQFVSAAGDPAQARAVMNVHLELTRDFLNAQLKAIDSLKATLAP